jgi:hypothetical protein
VRGRVPMLVELSVRPDYATIRPWVERASDGAGGAPQSSHSISRDPGDPAGPGGSPRHHGDEGVPSGHIGTGSPAPAADGVTSIRSIGETHHAYPEAHRADPRHVGQSAKRHHDDVALLEMWRPVKEDGSAGRPGEGSDDGYAERNANGITEKWRQRSDVRGDRRDRDRTDRGLPRLVVSPEPCGCFGRRIENGDPAVRRDERRGSRLPCDGGRRSGPRASSWIAARVVANRPAVTPPRLAQGRSFVLGASGPGCWCFSSPPTTGSARWSPHQEVAR